MANSNSNQFGQLKIVSPSWSTDLPAESKQVYITMNSVQFDHISSNLAKLISILK